jgi:ABC-type multidrug transport system permease subunit
MYYDLTFLLAKFIADIPFNIILNIIFATIVFWATNISSSWIDYIYYCMIVIVMAQSANFLAQLTATVFPDDQTANLGFTMIMPIMLLFSGFLIPQSNIPQGWIWLHWADFATYQLFFMASVVLADVPFSCPNGEGVINVFVGVSNSSCSNTNLDYSNKYCWQTICPITNGNQMLEVYSVNSSDQWIYFAASCAFLIGIAAVLVIAFHKVRHLKR